MSEHHVVVLGAGIGGLGLAIQLKQAGIDDFVVLEKGEGVGGTWRDNTYPGAACDVPSHLYSYSFDLNPNWSRTYGRQPEILAYLEDCADRHDVRSRVHCGTTVTRAQWDGGRWQLETDTGRRYSAQVVVSALGMLNVPSYPDIPGLSTFAGGCFHSARWDHSRDLTGQRVGVIGTGASAVQLIPPVAEEAEHLTVFQRSAPWILPRLDHEFTDEERARFASSRWAQRRARWKLYLAYEMRTTFKAGDKKAAAMAEFATTYRNRKISDPELQAALTPDYEVGCKRVLISSDFYPAVARGDVVVETDSIERVEPDAVVTGDGTRHEVDTLILATGFRASEYLHGLEVVGRDGRRLHDEWADAAQAYMGLAAPGYPNFFMLYGPNTNQGGNSIIFLLEAQARYVVKALQWMQRRSVECLEVKPDVMRRYQDRLEDDLVDTVWATGCRSYFATSSGRIVTQLPHRSSWYWWKTRRFRGRDYVSTSDDHEVVRA